MKNIFYAINLLVLLIALLPSCDSLLNKENDYLPLKVGAKYKYNYSASYAFVYESSIKKGECTWKFISKSVNSPVAYQVEQSFTGDSIYYREYAPGAPSQKDSTHLENQISTLSFEVQNDGKVSFTFPVPFWHSGIVTFERLVQSDKTDTCFVINLRPSNQVCLRKNVGISNLYYSMIGNHIGNVSYSLIEGPYY